MPDHICTILLEGSADADASYEENTSIFDEVFKYHTGKCIRRFGGIYAYCRYFIDRKC